MGPPPDRIQIDADMPILLRQDLANIEAGLYPLPADHDGSLLTLLQRSRLFFEDLPEISFVGGSMRWPHASQSFAPVVAPLPRAPSIGVVSLDSCQRGQP